eukprot:7512500-Pyramimonas_sp.AAC.1
MSSSSPSATSDSDLWQSDMAIRTPSSARGRLPCSRFSSVSAYCTVVAAGARCGSGSRAGLGVPSRTSGGAACASGGGAVGSAGAGGTCPCPYMPRLVLAVVLLTARTLPRVVFLVAPPAMLGVSVM